MIRVAYILESFDFAGAEKSVFNIAKYLNKDKFIPIIISIELGGDLEKEFDVYGIEHHVVDTGGILSVKGMKKLYDILKKLEIDIIHTNTTKSHIQSRLISIFLKNKIVVSSYRNAPKWFLSSDKRDLLRKIIDRSTARFLNDILIFVSKGTLEYFSNNGYYNSNTKVIYNSIDVDLIGKVKVSRDELNKRFNIKENQIIIVSIGRLTEQKGYEFLFPAINQVSKKLKNVKLLIFGEDQSDGYYEKLIKTYKYIDYSIIDSYPKMLEVLSIADVFVSSSLWEGLPRAHLESLLCGCPVISTDIIGSNEVIKNKFNGLLVAPRNSKKITIAINEILNSGKDKYKYSLNGFSVLRDKFDIKKNTIKLEKLYLGSLKNG